MKDRFTGILNALADGLFKSDMYDRSKGNIGMGEPKFTGDMEARASITIDDEVYEIIVKPGAEGKASVRECPKSTHGRHTPVDGKCIGCGAIL